MFLDPIITALWAPSTVRVGAILLVVCLAVRRAESGGLDPLRMFSVSVVGLVGALVGGDWYCLAGTPHRVGQNPWLLAQVLDGPKAMFGALLGTVLAGVGMLRLLRAPVQAYVDAAVPAVALGYAVYRLGCLWYGCEVGTPTGLPWAVEGPDGRATHPVAAYHGLLGLGLYLGLRRLPVGDGRVAFFALGAYGLIRFGLEFVRVEPVAWFGLHPGHWWSLLAVVLAALGLGVLRAGIRRRGPTRFSSFMAADR